jgi:hypothetical protein
MDAAWVKVVVLTLAECVAPEGKTVCQEQDTQYYFFEEDECETVLQQLVTYRSGLDNVIVNSAKSSCLPTIVSRQTFSSSSEADRYLSSSKGWGEIAVDPAPKDFMQAAHDKRLDELPECSASADVAPCKRGQIIIEQSQSEQTQVWRQEK